MSDFMFLSTVVIGLAVIFLSALFTYGLRRDTSVPASANSVFEKIREKPNRRYVKDVKPGDIIQIEWYRYVGKMGHCLCINNDPETEKILLEFKWNNYKQAKCQEKERVVFNYKDKELENFHLLNLIVEKPKPQAVPPPPQQIPEPQEPKSILKTVNCNYRGYLIIYDVHGEKVHELSGQMTYEKYKEIESRKEPITEFDGIENYRRIAKELEISTEE